MLSGGQLIFLVLVCISVLQLGGMDDEGDVDNGDDDDVDGGQDDVIPMVSMGVCVCMCVCVRACVCAHAPAMLYCAVPHLLAWDGVV